MVIEEWLWLRAFKYLGFGDDKMLDLQAGIIDRESERERERERVCAVVARASAVVSGACLFDIYG